MEEKHHPFMVSMNRETDGYYGMDYQVAGQRFGAGDLVLTSDDVIAWWHRIRANHVPGTEVIWDSAHMVERYLNVLTVRLRGYTGRPLPENLAEEIALQVTVGSGVDVEQLAQELGEDVGSGPRSIRQSITETSWGASGSGAELIVDVPAVLTGLASLPVLWDVISRRILRRGQARVLDAQTQAKLARAWLAESLGIGVDAVRIIGLEPVGDGYRVELETSAERFDVEIDSRAVTHMRRR